MKDIKLLNTPLSIDSCNSSVETPEAGGIVTFVGTVRNKTQNKKVIKLEFEAYEPMAIKEMDKTAKDVLMKFDVLKIAIYHRIGSLGVGEVPVVIAVSAPHRAAAFDACEYCIDTLKQTVPIWKKEIFEDGDIWVAAHP